MERSNLRESLDACRPGSADLAHSELADARAELDADAGLRRRVRRAEQFDRSVAGAMQDVAVPAGLQERLLAALGSALPAESAAVDAAPRPDTAAPSDGKVDTRRRAPMLVGSAFLALATGLLVTLTVRWFFGGDEWAPRSITDAAVQKFAAEYDPRQPQGWTQHAQQSKSNPLSRQLVHDQQPPQRSVSKVAGCSGTAYRLRSRQGAFATLLVLVPRATLNGFPTKPPRSPQSDTAGCAASSWCENDRLYVLVVSGGAEEYRTFLRRPSLVAQHAAPIHVELTATP